MGERNVQFDPSIHVKDGKGPKNTGVDTSESFITQQADRNTHKMVTLDENAYNQAHNDLVKSGHESTIALHGTELRPTNITEADMMQEIDGPDGLKEANSLKNKVKRVGRKLGFGSKE